MLLLIPYSCRTWINAIATAYQALLERNKLDSWIVPEPCACAIILVPCGRGLTFNCSIARVVLQRAVKLGEIVIYDRLAVQCDCLRSIRRYQVHIISYSFGENRLGAQCAYTDERGRVAILIVPALVLRFSPKLELYSHISTPWNYISLVLGGIIQGNSYRIKNISSSHSGFITNDILLYSETDGQLSLCQMCSACLFCTMPATDHFAVYHNRIFCPYGSIGFMRSRSVVPSTLAR